MISAEIIVTAQFGDLDPMHVVWHGNYVRYLEQARSALMDKIGYNYLEMNASGYSWPIVDLRIKFVKPVRLSQRILVEARLVEYENRIRIDYRCRDEASRETLTKAHTIQVAVVLSTGELCLESPAVLTERVRYVVSARAAR